MVLSQLLKQLTFYLFAHVEMIIGIMKNKLNFTIAVQTIYNKSDWSTSKKLIMHKHKQEIARFFYE